MVIININILKMETVIELTESELSQAFLLYNKASLENPEDFVDISDDLQCAKDQADALLKYLVEVRESKGDLV